MKNTRQIFTCEKCLSSWNRDKQYHIDVRTAAVYQPAEKSSETTDISLVSPSDDFLPWHNYYDNATTSNWSQLCELYYDDDNGGDMDDDKK